MKTELKINGYWWLPEQPDEKVFGTLQFIPGEILVLELQGVFQKYRAKTRINTEFFSPTIILGLSTEGGNKFTLSDCSLSHYDETISIMSTRADTHVTSFECMAAFEGVHFDTKEKIEFSGISIRLSDLEEWANKRNIFSREFNHETDEETYRFRLAKPLETKIGDTEFKFIFAGPSLSQDINEIKVSYEARIQIVSTIEKKFDEIRKLIRQIQNFFGLAMGAPTFPIDIVGFSKNHKEEFDTEIVSHTEIQIYYPVSGWPKKFEKRYLPRMLFTLPAVHDEFNELLKNWITKYDNLKPVISLYFSILYNPSLYLENQFISLTQALETYHRRTFDGSYQETNTFLKEIYPVLIEAIPSGIDKEYKESIKGRFRYLNEYSLRKRLREIILSLEKELDFQFVQNSKERNIFIGKVVDIRNIWTHYPVESKDKVNKFDDEFIVLTAQLQLLLEVSFLKELEFKSESIREIIKRSQHFQLLNTKGIT